MGIKKYAPYRKGGNWDRQRPERLKEFREKLNVRKANGNGGDGEAEVKKRKGKKERQRAKVTAAGDVAQEPDGPQAGGEEKKRKLEEPSEEPEATLSKKRKRRHKKSLETTPAQ